MPKPYSPQSHTVFNKLVSIHIPNVATLAPRNESRREHRILIVALGVSVRASRNARMRLRFSSFDFANFICVSSLVLDATSLLP